MFNLTRAIFAGFPEVDQLTHAQWAVAQKVKLSKLVYIGNYYFN
jgi:hypothetical protein